MTTLQYVLGILLVICSLSLILAILGQSAKSKRLGGAITGGAETFLGKEKGKKADILLNKLTIVLVVLLGVLTIAMYVFQPNTKNPDNNTPPATSQDANVSQGNDVSDAVSATESLAEVSDVVSDAESEPQAESVADEE